MDRQAMICTPQTHHFRSLRPGQLCDCGRKCIQVCNSGEDCIAVDVPMTLQDAKAAAMGDALDSDSGIKEPRLRTTEM